MNRAEAKRARREAEKKTKVLNMTMESFEASLVEARKQERERCIKEIVRGMLVATALAARDEYDFGAKRLKRLMTKIESEWLAIDAGYISLDDIEQVLYEETGFKFAKR